MVTKPSSILVLKPPGFYDKQKIDWTGQRDEYQREQRILYIGDNRTVVKSSAWTA
jgi:hypothetical protein